MSLPRKQTRPLLQFVLWKRLRVGLDRLIRRVEKNVPVYADGEAIASRDFDGRLDIEIAARDCRASLGHVPADGCFGRLGRTRVVQNALILALRDIKTALNRLLKAAEPNRRL